MGIYRASPWGDVSGKVGDWVGGDWKGIRWARKLVIPANPGSISRHQECVSNPEMCHLFACKQMNIRFPVLGMLGYIASRNDEKMIRPVFDRMCEREMLQMTGHNLFVRVSAKRLYDSLPTPDTVYNMDNLPDYSKMFVSVGRLEPVSAILKMEYTTATGNLRVEWSGDVFADGKPGDRLHVMVYRKTQVEDLYYRPFGFLYTPAPGGTRGEGSTDKTLPTGLDAADLTGFVFFDDTTIGYSPSKGLQAVAPGP